MTNNTLKTSFIKFKIWVYQHIYCNSIFFIRRFSYRSIPIIINNFNRLSFLKRLIASLEKRGYKNIYIIDNNSTYGPLLEYYKECPYTIFRLNKNVGYKAIWETDIYEKFKHSLYVYTDSDMEIDDSCPDDFMKHFIDIMKKHPLCQKVGFGIRIDNLPDCFKHKQEVIKHESQFWNNEVSENIFRAPIDTTFALYRPLCKGPADYFQETYRTGFPYVIKHLPWYMDSNNLNQEESYYINSTIQSTHWTQKLKS